MNKNKLFECLEKKKKSDLISLLSDCYDSMKTSQISEVFSCIRDELSKMPSDGNTVLKNVKKFFSDSLNGVYYVPFDINSKNFMNVPEETDTWFEKLGEFMIESSNLSAQGDHVNAVKSFEILFELSTKLGDDEIVFADELGMWMLPIDEKPCISAYFKSAAAILNPDEYANAVLPVIREDSYSSFCNKAYEKAIRAANKEQKTALDQMIDHHKIKTGKHSKC